VKGFMEQSWWRLRICLDEGCLDGGFRGGREGRIYISFVKLQTHPKWFKRQ